VKRAAKSGAPAAATITVNETVKFAGQEVSVEKTLVVGSKEHKALQAKEQSKKLSARGGGGLDNVMSLLAGPKAVSATAKSSSDWDNFKEKAGISEELEVATKNGFLEKKDFLDRCDTRKFEIELAGREKDRNQKPKKK
jgi:hypothetical protein